MRKGVIPQRALSAIYWHRTQWRRWTSAATNGSARIWIPDWDPVEVNSILTRSIWFPKKFFFFFAIKKIPIYLMNRIRWQSKTQRAQLVLRCLAGSYSFNFLNWWWNLNVFQLIWCNFVVVIGRLSPSSVLVFLRRCDPAGTSQWAAAPLNWVSETEPTASPRQRRKIRHQPPTSLRPFRNFMLLELLLFDFG